MNKKIPKIFVNKIGKINNNSEVYYSYKDNSKEEVYSNYEIQNKINTIFNSNNFVYKKKIYIKTKTYTGEFIIISKSIDYLLTLNGKKIYINEILDIK